MICLMVFNLTTPEDFSLPASLGSVSERTKTWFTMQESVFLKYFQYSSCSPQTLYNTAKLRALRDNLKQLQWRADDVSTYWRWRTRSACQRPVFHSLHRKWAQISPQVSWNQLNETLNQTNSVTSRQEKHGTAEYILGETAEWLADKYFGYLHVRRPSRRRGIVWWLELLSGPLGSYASLSSLPPFDLSASRSLPCRCPMLPEQHSGRWPSALLCETK